MPRSRFQKTRMRLFSNHFPGVWILDERVRVVFDVRDFKIQSRDGNENVKKNVVVGKTTFQVRHTFWYISLLFLFDYDVKLPNFMFYGGSKQATTKFYFSF